MQDIADADLTAVGRIVADMLADVPGLEVGEPALNVSRQPAGMARCRSHDRRERGVVVPVMSWSPSFHRRRHRLVIDDVQSARAAVDRFGATQRARVKRAAALGIDRPLPGGDEATGDEDTAIGHMKASATGLRVLHEWEGGWSYVASGLRRAVDEHLTDRFDFNQRHTVEGMTIHLRYDIGEAMVAGRGISIRHVLPQIVVNAGSGLRLGDVVRLHALLDDRRIARIEPDPYDDGRTRIILRPDDVPVDRIMPTHC